MQKLNANWESKPKLFGIYYVCQWCNKKFRCERELVAHKNVKEIECLPCKCRFYCLRTWANHKQEHHPNGYKCDQCNYIGETKLLFDGHYKYHTKKLSCESCGAKFGHTRQLRCHQMQHKHGTFAYLDILYQCDECEKTYRTQKGLNHHKRRSHRNEALECDVCGRILKGKWSMAGHLKTHFEEECKFCGKLIIMKKMPEHVDTNHVRNERAMSCKNCDKRFLCKRKFIKHINAKPIKCLSCQITLNCRILWQKHRKNLHQAGFKCSQCSFVVSLYKSFGTHLRSHAKRFRCNSCHKSFVSKHRLIEHQKLHTLGVSVKNEALKCDECEQTFQNSGSLKDHKKFLHGFSTRPLKENIKWEKESNQRSVCEKSSVSLSPPTSTSISSSAIWHCAESIGLIQSLK